MVLRPKSEITKNILFNNLLREKKNLSEYACLSKDAVRHKGEDPIDKYNIRPAFFHDTDRIIHSQAYTRYIDKTQVFYLFDNDHITHRVLHVQLVSKIARTIGRFLRLNEDLIEAISLAHDIGHTPYGHNGERRLNHILINRIGRYFCHNAQSVRMLTQVENEGNGMNLTLQVLDGILCHNGEWMLQKYTPIYDKTWKDFENEYDSCWIKKDYSKEIIPMTLEGCVMRISDVIAYLGRDFEDAITLGLIKRNDIPIAVAKVLGNNNRDIVNTIIVDLINNSFDKKELNLSDSVYKAINEFYSFSKDQIYKNPKRTTQDEKIENMFEHLFRAYLKDLKESNNNTSIKEFLSGMNSEYIRNTKPEIIVSDYISGMTDKYFNNQFKEFLVPKSFGLRVENQH